MLSHPTGVMQYFQAVQAGKKRANESQMKLFDIAGFAMLTLTTKKIDGKFFPVARRIMLLQSKSLRDMW